MQVWKEFDGNEVTHSMAHYLMAISDLLRRQGYARVTDVARELEITAGSASVALKTLKQKGYVEEDHNKFLRLSPEGYRLASGIHVSNRAFIVFLTEVLGMSPEKASVDACKVEHLLSDETRERMIAFVHFVRGNSPASHEFLAAFRNHHLTCPGPKDCGLCDTDVCMLHCPCSEPEKQDGK